MSHIQGEVTIDRPVEEVFDFVVDERNEPQYNPRMLRAEKLTEGPIGVGTRFQATAKTGRGTATMEIDLTEFDRPRRFALLTKLPTMDIRGAVTFSGSGPGTLLRWSWDLKPRGALRLLGPIVTLLGHRNERAIWTGLKAFLETDDEGRWDSPTADP